MRNSVQKLLAKTLVVAFAGLVTMSSVHAALFATEKEILRKYRVQWLQMKKYLPIVEDRRINDYVSCVAYRIVDALDDEYKDLNWEVIVFDDDVKNAQVLPGGKIAVYSGILQVADTPAALAAVIGHEAAHLTQNHVIERERAYSKRDALVLLGNAATGLGGMIQGGADVAMMLPYQREQESEADLVGMQYMAKAGFDPRATLYLWKRMGEDTGNRGSDFFSTHPSPGTRSETLAHNLAPALIEYNKQIDAGNVPHCAL
jgi:predicted Zn-dependent protease